MRFQVLMLVLVMGTPEARADGKPACSFTSKVAHVTDLKVATANGGKAVEVSIHGWPAQVELYAGAKVAKVKVNGVLAFKAAVRLQDLRLGVPKGTKLADGRVKAGADTRLSVVSVDGKGKLRVRAHLTSGVSVGPFPVDCGDLSLALPAGSPKLKRPGRRKVEAPNRTFPLLSRPKQGGEVMTVRRSDSNVVLMLSIVGTKKGVRRPSSPWTRRSPQGWLKLRARWSDGAELRGWTLRDDLGIRRGQGYGRPRLRGCIRGRGSNWRVRVKANVPVYADAGKQSFATTTQAFEGEASNAKSGGYWVHPPRGFKQRCGDLWVAAEDATQVKK